MGKIRDAFIGIFFIGSLVGCSSKPEFEYDHNSIEGTIVDDLLSYGEVESAVDARGNEAVYYFRDFPIGPHKNARAYTVVFSGDEKQSSSSGVRYGLVKVFEGVQPNLDYFVTEGLIKTHVMNILDSDSPTYTELAFRENTRDGLLTIPFGANPPNESVFNGDSLFWELSKTYVDRFLHRE